jgi:predicted phage terminase large subunit-like protein
VSPWRALAAIAAFDRRVRTLDRLAPPRGIVLPRGLIDAVPVLIPGYERPEHLAEVADVLERAPHAGDRVAIHCAPRWGKTETGLVAIAKWLHDDPTLQIMYAAHSASLAHSKSARARDLALRAGVRIDPASRSKAEWHTVQGGAVRAFGADSGAAVGHGADILICDDLFRGIADAASLATRDRIWDLFRGNFMSRVEPDGSVILWAQRLHEDDLIGRAVGDLGFEYIRITPRDEYGHSRWPSRFPDEVLASMEAERGPWIWAAQYEGVPRSRDAGAVYGEPTLCSLRDLPSSGRDAIGVDLAHSARERSDAHAAVVMRREGDRFYVLDVRSRVAPLTHEDRGGRRIEGFTADLRALERAFPRAAFVMYAGGNAEPLVLSLLAKLPHDERVSIRCNRATADKFVRSQPAAAAYRAGKILIPRDAPWADTLIAHLGAFTGAKGGRDDIADAFAAAYDALAGGGGRATGTGEGSFAHRIRGSVTV